LQEVVSFVQNLGQGQKLFLRQVCILVFLILVMPATNAASERSFSVMRRLKNYLRSTVNQARLNHIMVLHIYKEQLDGLDLSAI